MLHARTTVAIIAVLGSAVPLAAAQETAAEVFDRSIAAIRSLETITYTVTVTGDGSMGKAIMPAGSANVRAARYEAPQFGYTMRTEIRGSGTDSPNNAEPEGIHTVYAGTHTAWLDHKRKAVLERPDAQANPTNGTVTGLLWVRELANVNPYARELNAADITLVGREDVAGEPCFLVEVDYAEVDPAEAQRNRGPRNVADTATDAKFWISANDFIPRKIVRINNAAGMINLEFHQEISAVAVNPGGFAPADLEVAAPEGYAPIVRPEPGKPAVEAVEQAATTSDAEEPAPKAAPTQPAPSFALVNAAGEEVTLEGGTGRVRVLYFWGTWCAPCRAVSPLISDMAERWSAQPVDVYGVAVREREDAAPKAYMEEKGYKHTLLLPVGGPRDNKVATDYKVRQYPTVVVISQDNKVAAVEFTTKDLTPEAMTARVERVVTDLLAGES